MSAKFSLIFCFVFLLSCKKFESTSGVEALQPPEISEPPGISEFPEPKATEVPGQFVLYGEIKRPYASEIFKAMPKGRTKNSLRAIIADDLSFFKCGYANSAKKEDISCEFVIIGGKKGREKNRVGAEAALSQAIFDYNGELAEYSGATGTNLYLKTEIADCKVSPQGKWDCEISLAEEEKKALVKKMVLISDYYKNDSELDFLLKRQESEKESNR